MSLPARKLDFGYKTQFNANNSMERDSSLESINTQSQSLAIGIVPLQNKTLEKHFSLNKGENDPQKVAMNTYKENKNKINEMMNEFYEKQRLERKFNMRANQHAK